MTHHRCMIALALVLILTSAPLSAGAGLHEIKQKSMPVPIAWGKPIGGIQVGLSSRKAVYVNSVISPIWINVWIRRTGKHSSIERNAVFLHVGEVAHHAITVCTGR